MHELIINKASIHTPENPPKDDSWKNSYGWNKLWKLFTPYILEQNHRQGENKEFADILNRIRIGVHTKDDIAKIKTKLVKT